MVANIAWTIRDHLAETFNFAARHLGIAQEEVELQSKPIN